MMPMTGTTRSTASASFQSSSKSKIAAPTMRTAEDMSDAIAIETKLFIESMSEVRLERSLAGVSCSIAAYDCVEILAESLWRKSRVSRSEAYTCMMFCAYVKRKMSAAMSENSIKKLGSTKVPAL